MPGPISAPTPAPDQAPPPIRARLKRRASRIRLRVSCCRYRCLCSGRRKRARHLHRPGPDRSIDLAGTGLNVNSTQIFREESTPTRTCPPVPLRTIQGAAPRHEPTGPMVTHRNRKRHRPCQAPGREGKKEKERSRESNEARLGERANPEWEREQIEREQTRNGKESEARVGASAAPLPVLSRVLSCNRERSER